MEIRVGTRSNIIEMLSDCRLDQPSTDSQSFAGKSNRIAYLKRDARDKIGL